ncbi:hypothetical protein [Curtobacterium sp. P97]|uniref:hypothetical protein n=1 Tax=Curtobacterium sp. P97 TaxID=2939562 RepID=UPI002041C8FE|nr:hypothetical protein [Curtobacterium sp. P97]MCM3521751.1 hypothetical protein [Curtobacterium sp. P97]
MAKDDRLYARFDIAMDEHPKIMLLSDAGFRALIEATLYSRRQLTDGFLAARIAERKWGRDVITELTGNDPERPSWQPYEKDGVDGYMIHDFAEHQTTNADIEAKRAAGRKGGLAKAARTGSKPLAPATDVLQQNASTTSSPPLAITETETETETPTSNEVGEKPRKRGTRIPEPFIVDRAMREWAAEHTPGVDVNFTTAKFVDHWRAKTGRDATKLDWRATWNNWLRNDYQRLPQRRPQQQPSRGTRRDDELLAFMTRDDNNDQQQWEIEA